jgi:trk system potassium uptake protein TrkH
MKLTGGRLAMGLTAALGLLILVGIGIFNTRGLALPFGSEMSLPRTVFAVVNAATLTGFRLPVNVDEYKPFGQATIFLLTMFSTLTMLIAGGCGLTRALRMPYTDGQIVKASLIVYALALVVGANLIMRQGVEGWAAVFQTASAFGNSGLIIGTAPGLLDWRTHLVLLPLGLLGGLGIPVVLDMVASFALRRPLHPHTGVALAMTAGVYFVGTLLAATTEWMSENDMRTALVIGSTEVLNNRSLGLPLGTFGELARPTQWVVMLLMLIGACPAGTGGGIKATTFYVLARDSARLIRGEVVGRLFGLACLWAGIYLLATLLLTVFMVGNEPQAPEEQMLFLVTSAIGNVGTSPEPIAVTRPSLYILTMAMLFGRFAPLGMIWWAAMLQTPIEPEVPIAKIAQPKRR